MRRVRGPVALLALAAAIPAAAYILPVPAILKRVGERRAALSISTLEVNGTLGARAEAAQRLAPAAGPRPGAAETTVAARFLLKVPGRCRLELSPGATPEAERPWVALRDGKTSGPLADLAPAVALVRAACALLATSNVSDPAGAYGAALARRGVSLGEVTLGRFDGRIAYVIGGREHDAKPLAFVEKDGFHPLRLVAPEGATLMDVRLVGWGSPTGGDWFPRAVEVFAKDAWLLRFTTEKAAVNAKLADALFP